MVGVGACADADAARASEKVRKKAATTGFMRGSIGQPVAHQLRDFLCACYIRQVLVSLGHPILVQLRRDASE